MFVASHCWGAGLATTDANHVAFVDHHLSQRLDTLATTLADLDEDQDLFGDYDARPLDDDLVILLAADKAPVESRKGTVRGLAAKCRGLAAFAALSAWTNSLESTPLVSNSHTNHGMRRQRTDFGTGARAMARLAMPPLPGG